MVIFCCLLINTKCIVSARSCITFSIYCNWEWHISNIVWGISSIFTLLYCPRTKYHCCNFPFINHTFGRFPITAGWIIFYQFSCNCFIHCVINCIRSCHIISFCKWIFNMYNIIHKIWIARSSYTNIGIPCSHWPSSSKVCIKWNCIRIIFNCLQVFQKFIWCSRQFINSSFFPHSLVVYDTACSSSICYTIYGSIISFFLAEIINFIQCIKITKCYKIICQLVFLHARWNKTNISPVTSC